MFLTVDKQKFQGGILLVIWNGMCTVNKSNLFLPYTCTSMRKHMFM